MRYAQKRHMRHPTVRTKALCGMGYEWPSSIPLTDNHEEVSCGNCLRELSFQESSMICQACRDAVDNDDPAKHRECPGGTHCPCQHKGAFPCTPPCGYMAKSIDDMDEHVVAMTHADPDTRHGGDC